MIPAATTITSPRSLIYIYIIYGKGREEGGEIKLKLKKVDKKNGMKIAFFLKLIYFVLVQFVKKILSVFCYRLL